MALPPRQSILPDNPSPLPTPPSSTTAIHLCFPSPTSVAQVVTQPTNPTTKLPSPKPAHSPNPSERTLSQPSPNDKDLHLPRATQALPLTPPEQPLPPSGKSPASSICFRPELANNNPSPPRSGVTKASFTKALDEFVEAQSKRGSDDPIKLVAELRNLFDYLDALTEQLTLRVTNTLFDALSSPLCMEMLLFLLSDISVESNPVITDVRKSYRYPYLVCNILANGTMDFREKFIASKAHISYLLSFLDGDVMLSTSERSNLPHGLQVENQTCSPAPMYCRENPVVVGNVVQILEAYLETHPEAVLQVFLKRPTLSPSLVNLFHIGSLQVLFDCLIPDRCVDDVTSMDPGRVVFDLPMSSALEFLANSSIFHRLAFVFFSATQKIYDNLLGKDSAAESGLFVAEQLSYNIANVYSKLVNKTIRATRLKPNAEKYNNLRIFSNESTANTLVEMVRSGVELFRLSGDKYVGQLHKALTVVIESLKFAEQDRERRVASVAGQPAALDTKAFESQFGPLLKCLMEVMIDVASTEMHGQTRLKIMELFVAIGRVCSDNVVQYFNEVKFGKVALKIMRIHPRNSLLHHLILQAVETALVSSSGGGNLARHWLKDTQLMKRTIDIWEQQNGSVCWKDARQAAKKPFLSAVLHIACCLEHWIAMCRDSGGDPNSLVSKSDLSRFETFFESVVLRIMEDEKRPLGGPKPKRRLGRTAGSGIGRTFGAMGGSSGTTPRRITGGSLGGRAHLVRSRSAHRFGYVRPISQSRLGDMFSSSERIDAFAGLRSGGATSFSSIFDVDSDGAL